MTSAAVVPIAGINVNRNVIQQDDHAITDHLEGAVDLHELIRAPNIVEQPNSDLARLIMNLVNTQGLAAKQSIIGTIIEPGRIGLILNNGRVEVCGTGRWIIPSPRASLARISSLSENPLTYESLTIVRVQKGAYGLARQNGKPIILGEGVHVYNDRLFQFVDFQVANQKEIHHGTIHILLVPIGEYALVEENNSPKILRAGRYVIDSNYFTVDKFVDVNSPHISHHTLHILRVPKGKVGLITNNNKPMLLAEGTFTFNVQVFTFDGIKDINEPLIRHGTITRFRVRNGEIGLAWDNNKPVFIDKPDFYEVDSPNFTFVNCVSATEKIIILGSCKRIIVNDGEVGISYVNGKLDILPPNTHVFNAVERIFQGFMSTKQEAIQLLEPGSKTNLLTCDTKDFVEVGIKAAVFYRISDPAQALLSVGDEKAITTLIRETSVATLQGIMRSSALNQVAQSKTVHVGHHATGADGSSGSASPNPAAPPQPTSTVFFDKVHDEFIFKLYESFKKLYGIEISNIRIESFKIVNSELAENISKQAIITAQTETRLANLTSQREIATTEMERDAAVLRIQTQAAAQKLATETQANNSATISEAEAKASSLKIEAQGMAEALLVRAEAEAKAIELKAAAEKKRAQDLSSTNLGQQLAVLSAQSKMVSEALGGVEKVIYLSSGTNLGTAPLALFGLTDFEADGADVKSRRK